jgi:hypothetical protein
MTLNLGEVLALGEVDSDADGVGESLRVRPPVGLNHYPIEAE